MGKGGRAAAFGSRHQPVVEDLPWAGLAGVAIEDPVDQSPAADARAEAATPYAWRPKRGSIDLTRGGRC